MLVIVNCEGLFDDDMRGAWMLANTKNERTLFARRSKKKATPFSEKPLLDLVDWKEPSKAKRDGHEHHEHKTAASALLAPNTDSASSKSTGDSVPVSAPQ